MGQFKTKKVNKTTKPMKRRKGKGNYIAKRGNETADINTSKLKGRREKQRRKKG